MDVLVRPAAAVDATAIAVVQVASWRSAYRGIVPDEVLAALDVVERTAGWHSRLTDRASGDVVHIAELGSRTVGFVAAGAACEPEPVGATAELYAIYVAPDCWRGGVGGALHLACLDALRRAGHRAVCLWVLEANSVARSFYERMAWRCDGGRDEHPFGAERLPIVRYRREL